MDGTINVSMQSRKPFSMMKSTIVSLPLHCPICTFTSRATPHAETTSELSIAGQIPCLLCVKKTSFLAHALARTHLLLWASFVLVRPMRLLIVFPHLWSCSSCGSCWSNPMLLFLWRGPMANSENQLKRGAIMSFKSKNAIRVCFHSISVPV